MRKKLCFKHKKRCKVRKITTTSWRRSNFEYLSRPSWQNN